MLDKVSVRLRPIVGRLNLPTVIKTAILPDESTERLFIATQVGEIYSVGDGVIETFLDIRPQILRLGVDTGGYDERGLLGMAFHPEFHQNGLFYLHYSVAGTQGPGAPDNPFTPNPCDPRTLSLVWTNRENAYNHIDTVEEWAYRPNGQPQRQRTLLNLRRPFLNHNGVNSLNFSPETGRLVLTTGDGGAGYDPYNLAQNDMAILGKIIEIDISQNAFVGDPPAVTRFNELPNAIQGALTVIAKGVRNIPGISYQAVNNQYIKYVGIVGQDMVESVYAFYDYIPIPVTQIVQADATNSGPLPEGFINFGWRGWEGDLPTPVKRRCTDNRNLDEKIIAFYDEAISTSVRRLPPLTCYYHEDPRPDKFAGDALTGVQAYMGTAIPNLTGTVVFTDFSRRSQSPARGALAYTRVRSDFRMNEYSIIEVDYDFASQSAYYTSLGTNMDQTRLYLGVYGSRNVADPNLGTVFEIISG